MSPLLQAKAARIAGGAAISAVLLLSPALAFAQAAAVQASTTQESAKTARIDFASANLPPATVEVDLSQEIFSDLFGLGDAAVSGVVEALVQSNEAQNSQATEIAAEQLAAAREIIQLAKEVVREVHVRVYEDFAKQENATADLASRFDSQLDSGKWDSVVKVRDGNDSAHISMLRVEGSILGIFVVVADGNDIVLANIVCDVSPENIKQLTATATKIGLKNGLQQLIEHKLGRHVKK
jgi:hypothetical protein